jgi:hypothetical protein
MITTRKYVLVSEIRKYEDGSITAFQLPNSMIEVRRFYHWIHQFNYIQNIKIYIVTSDIRYSSYNEHVHAAIAGNYT